jgi:hypothetical protein
MNARAHTFAFLMPPRDATRDVRAFQLRDLAAALELHGALGTRGYAVGETLLNHPPPGPDRGPQALLPMQLDRLGTSDLVVTVTRPPLSDRSHGDAKQVRRGWTALEGRILELWGRYLDVIARSHVRFEDRWRAALPPGLEDRRDMVFRTREGAFYKRLNACDGRPARAVPSAPRTAAFLLRESCIWPNGPDYLGIFGMDGTSTLLWAWQLRNVVSDLLDEQGLTMVELKGGELPERPTDLRWMADWSVEPVVVALR